MVKNEIKNQIYFFTLGIELLYIYDLLEVSIFLNLI